MPKRPPKTGSRLYRVVFEDGPELHVATFLRQEADGCWRVRYVALGPKAVPADDIGAVLYTDGADWRRTKADAWRQWRKECASELVRLRKKISRLERLRDWWWCELDRTSRDGEVHRDSSPYPGEEED